MTIAKWLSVSIVLLLDCHTPCITSLRAQATLEQGNAGNCGRRLIGKRGNSCWSGRLLFSSCKVGPRWVRWWRGTGNNIGNSNTSPWRTNTKYKTRCCSDAVIYFSFSDADEVGHNIILLEYIISSLILCITRLTLTWFISCWWRLDSTTKEWTPKRFRAVSVLSCSFLLCLWHLIAKGFNIRLLYRSEQIWKYWYLENWYSCKIITVLVHCACRWFQGHAQVGTCVHTASLRLCFTPR